MRAKNKLTSCSLPIGKKLNRWLNQIARNMVSFSDLGINQEPESFMDEKISINDIVNVPIVVHGFKPNVETVNGQRHVVQIEFNNMRRIFFTSSRNLISALESPKISFPFSTVIRSKHYGSKRGFEFS